MDKNKAVVEFLSGCPVIANNPLFFNFAEAHDNSKQLVTVANDKVVDKPYIDGSVLKRYTFTIIDYRSVVYQALVMETGFPNENVDEMFNVQSIIDWIATKNDARQFPNFGTDCFIESMEALTDTPSLNGVDTTTTPALAKYSVSIRIEYIDKSKCIWQY